MADRTLTPLPTEPPIAAVPGPVPIDFPSMSTALWAERMLLELLVHLLDHHEHGEPALQMIALTNHPDNRAHARALIEATITSGPEDDGGDPLRIALARLDAQWCSHESSIARLDEIGRMQQLLAITLGQIYMGRVRSLVVSVVTGDSGRSYAAGALTPEPMVYALELAKARIVRDALELEDELDDSVDAELHELEPEPA